MKLGSIIPTPQQLKEGDQHYLKQLKNQVRLESTLKGTPKIVGGERRFYTGDKYCIISRNGKILWFETREDGDYAIKSPE